MSDRWTHPLADQIACLVFAFDAGDSRRESVRELADRVEETLTASASLAREWEKLRNDAYQRMREASDERDELRAVVREARALRDSGYDGPFMGEPIEPLFEALRRLDKKGA